MEQPALLIASSIVITLLTAESAVGQRRPLDTRDAEPIDEGHVLIETGVTYAHQMVYPLSGLQGDLWQLPVIGLVVGVGPIADVEISGGPYNRLEITGRRDAPLAGIVAATGQTTHAVEDIVIGTKIRLISEADLRPAVAFQFAVRLPNAKHESGLGQDTTDFSASWLAAKSVGSVRVVGNLGFTIMSEPLDAAKQNDLLTYGLSLARPLIGRTELVAEITGRWSTRNGIAPVGTESRSAAKLGARYAVGAIRVDAAALLGLTSIDPDIGLTVGVSYSFKAFAP
jgi:hypothetical protein